MSIIFLPKENFKKIISEKRELQIRDKVMRRVRAIFFMKKIHQSLSAKLGVTIFLILFVSASVSVPNVIQNAVKHSGIMRGDLLSSLNYTFNMFIHTNFIIQFVLIWIGMTIFAVIVDVLKRFKRYEVYRIIPNPLTFLKIRF